MRKIIMLGAACLAFSLSPAALSAPTPDYELYRVHTGESVEDIAAARNLRADVLRSLNPALENVVFPEDGTVIFVPPAPVAPRRVMSSRSGRTRPTVSSAAVETVAAAAPVSVPVRTRSGNGSGLSDEEVATIFEHTIRPHLGGGPLPAVGELAPPLPDHQNVFVGVDGHSVSVPQARPRRPKVEAAAPDTNAQLSPRGQKVTKLLNYAFGFMGVPYVWGGEDPSGMDCSGFTQRVFCDQGMPIPRTADIQFGVGQSVPRGQEQAGDLIFFETYCPGPSHVGIYLGRQQFLHASSGAGYITIGTLQDEYFASRYLGAKRNW